MGQSATRCTMMAGVIATLAMAAQASPNEAVDVYVDRLDDGFHITAIANTRATVDRAWAILTDFNRLADFVPDMRSSRIVSAHDEPLRVEQRGVAHALLFKRQVAVTLAVTLTPMQRITFESVGGNLRSMHGEWRILPRGSGCRIEYSAVSEPDFWTPPLIGTALIRAQVREQVEGVVAEIERTR